MVTVFPFEAKEPHLSDVGTKYILEQGRKRPGIRRAIPYPPAIPVPYANFRPRIQILGAVEFTGRQPDFAAKTSAKRGDASLSSWFLLSSRLT